MTWWAQRGAGGLGAFNNVQSHVFTLYRNRSLYTYVYNPQHHITIHTVIDYRNSATIRQALNKNFFYKRTSFVFMKILKRERTFVSCKSKRQQTMHGRYLKLDTHNHVNCHQASNLHHWRLKIYYTEYYTKWDIFSNWTSTKMLIMKSNTAEMSIYKHGYFFFYHYEEKTSKPSCRWPDKPVRRESMPKIALIRRAYNVVADNTGLSSFVYSCWCVRNLQNPEKFSEKSNL